MQPDYDEFFRTNQQGWDELVAVHAASAFYDLKGFMSGKTSLHALELRELGDVAGKTLLHLQYHFGLDSLSWARLGAKVTGVDFSPKAIELARSLNDELGLDVTFIQANVYDLPDVLDRKFDIIFASYGVCVWLPDLERWARVIAHHLRPGGTFYLAHGHPFAGVLEVDPLLGIKLEGSSYFGSSVPQRYEEAGSYADRSASVVTTNFEWAHSLGEVVSALASAGLVVRWLHEHAACAWQQYPSMTQGPDGWWRLPPPYDVLPLTFSLMATR